MTQKHLFTVPLTKVDLNDLQTASLLLFRIDRAGELRASHAQHLRYVAMACESLLARFEAKHGDVDELRTDQLVIEDDDDGMTKKRTARR